MFRPDRAVVASTNTARRATMLGVQAVQCVAPGPDLDRAIRVTELDEPQPGPGEVVVKVDACALCRTDLQIVTGDLPARTLPIVPGHQVVGRVVAVGAGVEQPVVGAVVGLVWLAGACTACRFCLSNRENLCTTAQFTGWDRDGGMAGFVSARADFVHELPADLLAGSTSQAVAPLLCGGVIGYRSLRVAGIGPGSSGMRLGLYGFGASATIALQLAQFFGVQCYVVTRSPQEQARALEQGAHWAGTYDQHPPHPLDAAVTFAPAGEVVLAALRACDRGATVAINAIHLDGIPAFDYSDLWWERSLRSVANVTRADVAQFLALVGPAGIRTQSEAVGLADAAQAFRRLRDGDVRGALVFLP